MELTCNSSELKVDKFTGVTTAGSILVTGEGNSTTTNLQQGLAKFGQVNYLMQMILLKTLLTIHPY